MNTDKNKSEMTLNEYQKRAMSTCMDSCLNITYMLNGFVGEVGELTSKIAKARRHGTLDIERNNIILNVNKDEELAEFINGLKGEIGDCLWFVAGLCAAMGWSLEGVAYGNLAKLASRKERGVIDGNGDNR